MSPDVPMMVPISEADTDFSRVMHMADIHGCVVILKDNNPKYLLIDLEQESLIYDLTDEYSASPEPGVRRVRATIPVGQSQCSGQ